MTIVRHLWRRGLFLAAFISLAGGSLAPGHAHDAFNFDWLVGDDEQIPTSQPEHWELADGETVTALIGQVPAHFVLKAATCQMNYPYKGTWPGPESGKEWTSWTERMKQDQTLFLAGAFTREGAWLDSVSTQCSGIQADGSWTESKPLAATATGLGQNGIPTTMYNTLLYGVTANTGEWVKGERDCPTDITRPCVQSPDTWKMGGSPFIATCPKNSYIVGINAVIALEKNAIARIGVHCLNPLTGDKSFSGLRQTDNSDGTSNGLTYRLFPSSSQLDGVFCPQGQLANGFIGYNDWSNADDKSYDHLTAVGLICRAYTIIKPPVVAQVGYNRLGSDIDQPAMTADDPNACAAECAKNGACQAWSYVFKNVRGEAQCWLKNPAPVAIEDSCCISGVRLPLGADSGENRVGSDYYHAVTYSADPNVCADYCKGDAKCEAWTYVKPGVQGDNAVCWYKNAIPDETADSCCISGRKNPLYSDKPSGDEKPVITALTPPLPQLPPGLVNAGDALANGGVALIPGIPKVAKPSPGVTFAGTWLTTVQNGKLYTLQLSQNADGTVVGGYEAGTIRDGVIIGNQLYAHWQQGDATGTLDFTMAPDNAAFSGTWTNGDYMPTPANAGGTWDGYSEAIFTGVPGGDDFTGTWVVTQSEGETYEMKLAQTGDSVIGTYDPTSRGGILTGHDGVDGLVLPHLVFDAAKHPGDGWVQAGGSGNGWFYLYPDKTRLSGIWRMADNTNGAWSAVRKAVEVPATEAPAPVPAPVAIVAPQGACPAPQATVTNAAKVHRGIGDAIPNVTLASGSHVDCTACNASWCLIASADLGADAAGQSPTVARSLLDFGLTAQAPPPPPPPPAPKGNGNAPAPTAANFAGDWRAISGRDNCYEWHLDQQGASVSGTYNPLNATITGTVVGNQLHFDWTERGANMQPTASGSGIVALINANSFGGDWWSPAAANEPPGNPPVNVWQATRRLGGQPGCAAGGVAGNGGGFDLSKSRIGKLGKLSGDAPAVDVGGSANDTVPPPPPVIR